MVLYGFEFKTQIICFRNNVYRITFDIEYEIEVKKV